MKINQQATLSQIDTLIITLKRNENISAHFDLEDALENLKNITVNQVAYFHALLFHGKYSKLNKILCQFKFKPLTPKP